MLPAGLEIGSVAVKFVSLGPNDESTAVKYIRHEGNFRTIVDNDLRPYLHEGNVGVTGAATRGLLDFPYYPESDCLETAIGHHGLRPDMLLTLGGEKFTLYTLRNGEIRDLHSCPTCAAGGGEFLFQQFNRMGLSPEEGIAASRRGKKVPLAARCSVYCKSDATHKLNKGECTAEDICKSLIVDLGHKVANLMETAQWSKDKVLIAGGLTLNIPFIEAVRSIMPHTEFVVLPQSHVLEAFGAALKSRSLPVSPRNGKQIWLRKTPARQSVLAPLGEGLSLLDYRVEGAGKRIRDGRKYILGVDAGSTTTKAVLLNVDDGALGASVYIRTHGNPVKATQQCISRLLGSIGSAKIEIIQACVTGSGRELVALHLDNAPFFNEILAHGRATAEEIRDVDTVFEIGGQDAKFITFDNGVAVNYAMNDGCSAGTGSFLEESVLVDMGIPLEEIAESAFRGDHPVAFGERCAAFINTDIRNATQQGASSDDVVAGLIYSIAQNYLVKVVGHAQQGDVIAFQGGVALNKGVGAAFALLTGKKIVVPRYPELMGCVGAALMVLDRLGSGQIAERPILLDDFLRREIREEHEFSCPSCENTCRIRRINVSGKAYPFGGLCSKFENARLNRSAGEGRDLVAVRNRLMFEDYGNGEIASPRGIVGIPLALSSFELFPFYARLFNELGYQVMISDNAAQQDLHTKAPICYPAEIAHAAVRDLLRRGADHVFLPHAMGDELPWVPQVRFPLNWEARLEHGWIDGFFCHMSRAVPALVKIAVGEVDAKKLLTPMVSLSRLMWKGTLGSLSVLAPRLDVSAPEICAAAEKARAHYRRFRETLAVTGRETMTELRDHPTVILAGHPYVICSNRINLALPRKITSRGYHVVPVDLLPEYGVLPIRRNMWTATQRIENAITYARLHTNCHLCFVSCFACTPDAMLQHGFRQSASGQTYCYLEIDSHTAHAGFDTRIGAFFDILEQRRRATSCGGHDS